MPDAVIWFGFAALIAFTAMRNYKHMPYLCATFVVLALAMVVLETLDLRGGHARWFNWAFVAVVAVLGILSLLRDEAGARTRYALMWQSLRDKLKRS